MKSLIISKRAEKRLKSGHLWIFSNEVDHKKTPIKSFESGEQVIVTSQTGKPIAYALVNNKTLICGRIVSFKTPLDKRLISKRISDALIARQGYFNKDFYRLFYAEGDFLPGLVIDRYGDYVVVQINSPGLVPYQEMIAEILMTQLKSKGVLFRNDAKSRLQEGLIDSDHQVIGEVPELIQIEENGCQYKIPVYTGQKTGWFFDHRDNRAKIARFSQNKRVLDVFSYIGAWGVLCLNQGAKELISIDASSRAMALQQENARLNGLDSKLSCIQNDAFEALEALVAEKEKFDIVILDPPAFIKKKKDLHNGLRAYEKINELAIRLLQPGGYLASASCSMHLEQDALQAIVQGRIRHLDRKARLCFRGGHPVDHPIHPAIKETEYLKAQFYQVLR